MKAKPVVPREQANRDVDEAITYYVGEGTPAAALGFIDALEQAYVRIGRNPSAGSTRYAHELNLPGLRSLQLQKYAQLVLYIERADHIDVWRVLHGKQDIPYWMSEPEGVSLPDR